MSKILEALEKANREEPLAREAGGPAGVIHLGRWNRTLRLSDAVLRRAGWFSALERPPAAVRSYSALAAYLVARVPPPARVLVFGAAPGAGATSLSLNLATEIALSGKAHALWCDVPHGESGLGTLLGPVCQRGARDHLATGVTLREFFLRIQVSRLSLLPFSGRQTSRAGPPSSEEVVGLYRELRDRYDDRYVVLDAPPPGLSRLTKVLAETAEAAVLVVAAGTPHAAVDEALEAVGRPAGVTVFLNRVPGLLLGRNREGDGAASRR